jgi:pimeloyl-ACP methyl ester carboxylesterase
MRTQGVDHATLRSTAGVQIADSATTLAFVPQPPNNGVGLIFFCGSGVAAYAYAPLIRPVAEAGYAAFVIKLPYRFAPLETHKEGALARARAVITDHPEIARWVIAGHSLGGALASRFSLSNPENLAGLVLVGTTHPKDADLSFLEIPVVKIYGTNDGVAPTERVLGNRRLLPAETRWVEIPGGNHSQFGHYGHQIFDGRATISRTAQQMIVRSALLDVLGHLR